MKKSVKNKILEAVKDLEKMGGTKDLEMKKVAEKLKKAVFDEEKSKK